MQGLFRFLFLATLFSLLAGCANNPSFKTTRQNSTSLPVLKNQLFIVVQISNLDAGMDPISLYESFNSQFTNTFKQAGYDTQIAFLPITNQFSSSSFGLSPSALECNKSKIGHCLLINTAEYETRNAPGSQGAALGGGGFAISGAVKSANPGPIGIGTETGNVRWRATLFQIVRSSAGLTSTVRSTPAWTAESGLTDFSSKQYSKDKYVSAVNSLSRELATHMQTSGLIEKNKP